MFDSFFSYLAIPLLLLIMFGSLRTYLRTGLRGELIVAIGGFIFVFAYLLKNIIFLIVGGIIINIGLIYMVTIESGKRKEIFEHTTFFERFLCKVPHIDKSKDYPPTVRKSVGILTGILCLIFSIIFFKKLEKYDITEITFIGILVFGGVYFIVFSIFKGTSKR